jgi:hypothetical protein
MIRHPKSKRKTRNLEGEDEEEREPLLMVVKTGNLNMLKTLLENGNSPKNRFSNFGLW